MNRESVISFLASQGLGNIIVADSDYSFPSEQWIQREFAGDWKTLLHVLNLSNYVANKNDCDKFARLCATYAAILHGKSSTKQTGLAFGEFYYVPKQGAHAINFAIVADVANAPKLLFFEPQTGGIIALTDEERKSCTLCKV